MNRKNIKMRSIIMLFFSSLFVMELGAQTAKIVVDETVNGNGSNQGKSYLIVTGLRLQNFKWTASTNGSFYARMVDPDTQSRHPNLDHNFVKKEDVQVGGITSEPAVISAPVGQKFLTYGYVDGLGRSDQEIQVQSSPGKLDVVSFTNFNSYGRQLNEYLPYAIQGGKGGYRSSPTTEAIGFYQNTPLIGNDDEPYKINLFDNPGADAKQVAGPGDDWHSASKYTEAKTIVNGASQVRKWIYSGPNSPASSPNPPLLTGHYPAQALVGSQITDEQGQIKQSFRNFKDQVVLERTGDGTNWFETYYVYDWAGNIFCVLPPEASAKLGITSNYESASNTTKQTFLNDWAFQYDYDNYGRMVGKKVPGADWAFMVYDKWDRLVLTQDGKQRSSNQWTFTKYDAFNRPIVTGFYTLAGNQAAAQSAVNSFASFRYEERIANSTGYTLSQTFPSNPPESDLLNVIYYDDYRFRDYPGWDAEGKSYSFVSENGIPSSFCTVKSPNTYCTILGQTTGSKIRIVGTSTWLNSVTYYDNKYRAIQTITENHLGGTDRISNDIDFAGRTKKTLRTHTSTGNNFTVLEEYDYDHTGRPTNTWQTLDGGSKILVSSLKYNELGEVVEKNLHSTNQGGSFLQSVDYRYNVRGWLTSINNSTLTNDGTKNNDADDLFGMELLYNQQESIQGANSPQMWNGNIGAIKWQSKNLIDASKEKAYRFNYDVLNRLSAANYATKNSGTFTGDAGAYNTTLSYSKNGNIQNLTRTGIISGAVQTIDNLTYVYGSGNQLRYVTDASSYQQFGARGQGFVDHQPGQTTDDYTYDGNGNATQDNNRSVDITYNHLNVPTRVEYDPSNYITYAYDALGSKLQQKVFKNGSLLVQRDYIGGAHFEGGSLKFLNNTEGRAIKSGTGWQYEYQLRDHQGNTMASFGSLKDASVYTATMEVENADKEVIESTDPASHNFYNINITNRSTNFNHTVANAQLPTPNESVLTNANIGPGKLLSNVNTGDRVKMSIYARYASGSGSLVDVLSGMLAITTSTFGIGSGEAAYGGFSSHLASGLNNVTNDGTTPKAYLNYFLFNSTFSSYQFGFYPIPPSAALGFEKLEMDITIPAGYSNGYLYIYATNESDYNVYFDDMNVLHERTNPLLQVTQLSDYYPFGVSFNEWNKQSVAPNRYLYQGQEMQDDIDYLEYQYKFRTHDPTIGRFMSVDPLAEDYKYNSSYAFSENRVIDGVELEGLEQVPANEIWNTQLVPVQSIGSLSEWFYPASIGGVNFQFFQIMDGLNEGNFYGRALLGKDEEGNSIYQWTYLVGAERIEEVRGRHDDIPVGGQKYQAYAVGLFSGAFKYNDYVNPSASSLQLGSWLKDQWTTPENYVVGASMWASSLRTVAANTGGRLGSAATRSQIYDIATTLESKNYTITGGGGRFAEEYLKPIGGGRAGGSYVDITATHPSYPTLRINTVDVYKNGVTTVRELNNAARIRTQIAPGEHLLLIPKR